MFVLIEAAKSTGTENGGVLCSTGQKRVSGKRVKRKTELD